MAVAKGPSARARNGVSLAQAKWRSSALTDLHAKRLRMRELTATETGRLKIPNVHPVRSLYMPYFDLKGKPTGFFRIRYLEPLTGFAGMVEDQQRYAQEGNTINEVYLPPLLKKSWEEIANDPDVSVLVTEGELKSASGCAIGYATIGLGGVDVWRASKRSIDLLPALAKFKWKDRSVVFVFDSDLSENPNVVRAQRALAKELLARGARPAFASLPGAKGGGKQGLDDFILAQGGDALEKVIEEAPPFLESDALWSMNEDYLCIDKPAVVVSRVTGQLYDPGKFVSFHCANRNYIQETVKDDRVIQTKKPLAKRWLNWEQRSQVSTISYVPGAGRYHEGTWNMWQGWGCEPKKGDIGPWKRMLDHIFGGDHAARKYFEQWCAYPIQHPGAKLYTACLLFSQPKGVGKTLIAYSLMGIYGGNSVEIKSKDLKGNFNSWAKDRQFVYGDEITAGEARVDADYLKGIITQHTVMIKEKFIPDYSVSDHMNYLFSSNHLDALFVEDGDRRYFIWEILTGVPGQELIREYDRWLGWNPNEGKATGPGPAALFHHFLNLDLTGFNPKDAAPDTPGKQSMTRASRNELALWLHELKIDPFRLLRNLGDKAAAECEIFTPSQLLRAFDPEKKTRYTDVAMGRALWSAKIPNLTPGGPIRTKAGFFRFYAIRNVEKWKDAKPKKIALAWERFFGPEAGRY